MSANDNAFEIHVHGDVKLRPGTRLEAIEEALKPLWQYAGARSLAGGAASLYEEEPGIRYDTITRTLQMCWTVEGGEDFRQQLDDLCMNLNDLAEYGAPIEVSFYDVDFDEDDEDEGREARDDFVLLFIGPTPQAIMQVQRDLLVEDVVRLMERHFDSAELGGVVHAIDQLAGHEPPPWRLRQPGRFRQRGRPRRRAQAAPSALTRSWPTAQAPLFAALFFGHAPVNAHAGRIFSSSIHSMMS